MNCEDCKYSKVFKTFYDEWKGWQWGSECTADYEKMPIECARELGILDEWEQENER